jgi:hypothetical protein
MELIVECPNCGGTIEILEINCGIFRHGILIETMEQINPHAPEDYCIDLINKNLIYGCGKPFQLILENSQYKIIKCNYI